MHPILQAIRRVATPICISLSALLLIALAACRERPKYFEPTGIIDRTKELSGRNAWTALRDKDRIDGYTRIGDSVFGGEIACNVKPLQHIDVETFRALAGTKYAKDAGHVYYPLEQSCIDYTDCGVCYYSKYIVEGASPALFRYCGKDYATDGRLVFFRGKEIEGVDPLSFTVIEGPEYLYFATDRRHVYKRGEIFPEADPATFYYDKSGPANKEAVSEDRYIIGDSKGKWEYSPPDQLRRLSPVKVK